MSLDRHISIFGVCLQTYLLDIANHMSVSLCDYLLDTAKYISMNKSVGYNQIHVYRHVFYIYGGATTSRLLKNLRLFYKRALLKKQYSAKETYNFKEPTNRSHPISVSIDI